MATVELDPQFIKALRLLRSKSKDSGAQLRAMLDEAIRFKTRQLMMYIFKKIFTGRKRVLALAILVLLVSGSNIVS